MRPTDAGHGVSMALGKMQTGAGSRRSGRSRDRAITFLCDDFVRDFSSNIYYSLLGFFGPKNPSKFP